MISAVLIDDEEDTIGVIRYMLGELVNTPVKVLATASNLAEGIKAINSAKPDVVFLDIELPDKKGIDIYEYFPKPEFKIIFVTAYNQYAIAALKRSAIDYLLKPVNFIELRESIGKVAEEIEQEQHIMELEDMVNAHCSAEMEGQNIVLEISSGFIVENTKNIEFCYAERAYSVLVTHLGKEIIVSKSLKELQELLPSNQFFRTHKSFLVNIFYIRKFVRASESYVLLKSGKKIIVSSRTIPVITQTIKNMLES